MCNYYYSPLLTQYVCIHTVRHSAERYPRSISVPCLYLIFLPRPSTYPSFQMTTRVGVQLLHLSLNIKTHVNFIITSFKTTPKSICISLFILISPQSNPFYVYKLFSFQFSLFLYSFSTLFFLWHMTGKTLERTNHRSNRKLISICCMSPE